MLIMVDLIMDTDGAVATAGSAGVGINVKISERPSDLFFGLGKAIRDNTEEGAQIKRPKYRMRARTRG